MSLRARLLVGLLAVAAVGLFVADVATYGALRSFLVGRVDDQLHDAQRPVAIRLGIAARGGPSFGPGRAPPPGAPPVELPPGTYGELRDANGTVVDRISFDLDDSATVAPDLPATLPDDAFTTGSTGGSSSEFRVLPVALADGGTLVVAVPLGEVEQTLHRLLVIEAIVTTAVLVALLGLAWWVVRLGLRPLVHMESTADAIAAGDLSQRVEVSDERTEVGRLGLALNTMLGEIETAFAAREASEARLRRFVGDASHELRTPLTSIRGYAELFRRGAHERPDDLEKAMRRIEDEAQRMGILVDDLLLLARLDQGRPLERSTIDLAQLARDGVEDSRAIDPARPVTLHANGPVLVQGDEARLRQVVASLLDNARAHTPAGTAVEVRVAIEDGHAVLEVADRGPGMTAEDASHAFERFYRADTSRARTSGGSGLGLSIVAAIVDAHGGDTGLETAPGAGATFRVQLPVG